MSSTLYIVITQAESSGAQRGITYEYGSSLSSIGGTSPMVNLGTVPTDSGFCHSTNTIYPTDLSSWNGNSEIKTIYMQLIGTEIIYSGGYIEDSSKPIAKKYSFGKGPTTGAINSGDFSNGSSFAKINIEDTTLPYNVYLQ